jgi:hypothetical protein
MIMWTGPINKDNTCFFLLSVLYKSDSELCTLQQSVHLITTWWDRSYYPYFINSETEAREIKVFFFSGLWSYLWESKIQAGLSYSKTKLLTPRQQWFLADPTMKDFASFVPFKDKCK